MKVFTRVLCLSAVVALVAGCASDSVYIPKIPPHAQAKLLDYFEQEGNKVFIIAIETSGEYAFGYDYGKATLKEAAKVAVKKCDANREAHGITARPYIYALNNDVVYEEMIRKAFESGDPSEERAAQKKYGLEIDDDIEVEAGTPAEEM